MSAWRALIVRRKRKNKASKGSAHKVAYSNCQQYSWKIACSAWTRLFCSCVTWQNFLFVVSCCCSYLCVNRCLYISVEAFLEMACSVAVIGGGSNKEYALHILHRVNGNIKVIYVLSCSKWTCRVITAHMHVNWWAHQGDPEVHLRGTFVQETLPTSEI